MQFFVNLTNKLSIFWAHEDLRPPGNLVTPLGGERPLG